MASGQIDYIQVGRLDNYSHSIMCTGLFSQKGIRSAEQATAEDKAHNYEVAAEHYMTAAEWLMQAVKCNYLLVEYSFLEVNVFLRLDGAMNEAMKQNIRAKVNSYLKRAEEIKGLAKNGGKKKAVADGGNSKDNKDDDDSGDPDRKRMMQKFEGKYFD